MSSKLQTVVEYDSFMYYVAKLERRWYFSFTAPGWSKFIKHGSGFSTEEEARQNALRRIYFLKQEYDQFGKVDEPTLTQEKVWSKERIKLSNEYAWKGVAKREYKTYVKKPKN